MRNPFELIADLYDYQYQYYRWFVHRRILFSEMTLDSLKQDFRFNIFENKDYENIGSLVKQTTLIGFGTGLGFAPMKYLSLTELKKKTMRQALPAAFGVIALCTGVGLAYGAIVNATANYRGKKNDSKNHVVAALATFPAMGVYAKTNKIKWGLMNSVVAAGFLAYLKYTYSGKFYGISPDKQPSSVANSVFPSHYKPN
ncbi:unnamed protein product [Brachionus calyciflorus]|uniref:Complex I-B14.7 n=1 Tax=Brachionus calyciflorus TaxID=104777 RepID=A0A813SCS6_9BILA|nr:unnamed protein product [Brachionus calyciflorus]